MRLIAWLLVGSVLLSAGDAWAKRRKPEVIVPGKYKKQEKEKKQKPQAEQPPAKELPSYQCLERCQQPVLSCSKRCAKRNFECLSKCSEGLSTCKARCGGDKKKQQKR